LIYLPDGHMSHGGEHRGLSSSIKIPWEMAHMTYLQFIRTLPGVLIWKAS